MEWSRNLCRWLSDAIPSIAGRRTGIPVRQKSGTSTLGDGLGAPTVTIARSDAPDHRTLPASVREQIVAKPPGAHYCSGETGPMSSLRWDLADCCYTRSDV